MKHIQTYENFLNESSNAKGPGFKTINKSYPLHIKVLKKLYLVWDDEAEWYDWSENPGKKMNGELKKGEEFFFSHIFKPHNVAADGINYKEKNGKRGPEFGPADLERLVHDNAIEIVESVTEEQVAKLFKLVNPMTKSRNASIIFSGTYEECEKRKEKSGSKGSNYQIVPSY